jgi:hypothetical protein
MNLNTRLFLFGLLVLLISGCNNQSGKQDKAEDEARMAELMQSIMLSPKENRLKIISMKYEVPVDKINIIVSEYLILHDKAYRFSKQFIDKPQGDMADSSVEPSESVQETVTRLSNMTGIPTKDIASIIIDYEAWNTINQ